MKQQPILMILPTSITLSIPAALLVAAGLFLANHQAQAQGCVAVRGTGFCPLGLHDESAFLGAGDWQIGLSYRWLYSDRHFRGSHEERHRQAQGTEVINDSHFFDVNIVHGISSRFSAGLVVPFVYSERSAPYEHSGVRHTTRAGGLSDVRLTGYMWLWDPVTMPKGNISLGIGPKFPTGDYKATDIFHRATGPELGYVDQSIQPGDGGWGFGVEVSAFREVFPKASLYFQGSYLFNPENVNGVPPPTVRGNPYETVTSIPDQYFARGGFSYLLVPHWGLSLSLGGRIDGVPARDAIGRNDGWRRPGYAVYVDPGVFVSHRNWFFSLTVPVAAYRNRVQSVADKRWTADSGIYRHGDAAFADFLVQATITRQF
jgi:hypothetical protein